MGHGIDVSRDEPSSAAVFRGTNERVSRDGHSLPRRSFSELSEVRASM